MIGWIDGGAGASGDMLLGAMVGAGLPIERLQADLATLGLDIAVRTEPVTRGGLAATRVRVEAPDTDVQRRLADVLALLVPLPDAVKEPATEVFERLAAAEAAVHGTSIDDVHFHEVGALDAIADVVGVCAGMDHLDVAELHCSPLSLGSGTGRGAHGPLPVPVPAVLHLLRGVAPVQSGPSPFEATTPTGAALLATLVDRWGPLPAMTIEHVGIGAGERDPAELANALRLVLGRSAETPEGSAVQLDANVDDLDPRLWPAAIDRALAAGALDAWVTPITMKKGRPAHTFSVLCAPAEVAAVRRAVFADTSTIGLREHAVTRHVLERDESTVEVDGETIRVKRATLAGRVVNRSVEWDDVVAAAERLGRSPKSVLADANAAATA